MQDSGQRSSFHGELRHLAQEVTTPSWSNGCKFVTGCNCRLQAKLLDPQILWKSQQCGGESAFGSQTGTLRKTEYQFPNEKYKFSKKENAMLLVTGFATVSQITVKYHVA